jgi:hypothetical protein
MYDQHLPRHSSDFLQTTQIPDNYKPVLYRREEQRDRATTFHVLFIEQFSRGIIKAPDDLATLLSSLTLGNRLQWEVYEHYRHKIGRWKDEDLEDGCRRILEAMDNVEKEARFREQAEKDTSEKHGDRLLWAFPSDKRDWINENLSNQTDTKAQVRDALNSANREQVLRLFPQLQRLNGELNVAVSQRYHDLLEDKVLPVGA